MDKRTLQAARIMMAREGGFALAKKRGVGYFSKLGKLGMKKRWAGHKKLTKSPNDKETK